MRGIKGKKNFASRIYCILNADYCIDQDLSILSLNQVLSLFLDLPFAKVQTQRLWRIGFMSFTWRSAWE